MPWLQNFSETMDAIYIYSMEDASVEMNAGHW